MERVVSLSRNLRRLHRLSCHENQVHLVYVFMAMVFLGGVVSQQPRFRYPFCSYELKVALVTNLGVISGN